MLYVESWGGHGPLHALLGGSECLRVIGGAHPASAVDLVGWGRGGYGSPYAVYGGSGCLRVIWGHSPRQQCVGGGRGGAQRSYVVDVCVCVGGGGVWWFRMSSGDLGPQPSSAVHGWVGGGAGAGTELLRSGCVCVCVWGGGGGMVVQGVFG